ncbi:MAG: histidine phosphatase family protein [Gammaproteobacteria bacterium]|nr:histidine phosphatase family protein [Gammaproteobacteria bacterium]
MTRELLLLRHGKAEKLRADSDFDRPVSDPGKRGAQRMATWIWRNDLMPDYVISSPAIRALETARKACKAMGMGAQGIVEDQRIYEATTSDLLQVLADVPETARRVLLVGHNPGLRKLLSYLDGTHDGQLPKAALAHIKLPDNWSELPPECSRALTRIRPGDLPQRFPFPGPHDTELRDRPAYYYSQSSVIPWRLNNGEAEILVILSSKKKHWVIPKGIKEPGLSARESAAEEAREEAGVEGIVGVEPLGSYVYEKWGAATTCQVFPMQVIRELAHEEWEESHRDRSWVTPQQAAAQLKQPELGPMVEALAARLRGG